MRHARCTSLVTIATPLLPPPLCPLPLPLRDLFHTVLFANSHASFPSHARVLHGIPAMGHIEQRTGLSGHPLSGSGGGDDYSLSPRRRHDQMARCLDPKAQRSDPVRRHPDLAGAHRREPRRRIPAPPAAVWWPMASSRSSTTRVWRSMRWCDSRCVVILD